MWLNSCLDYLLEIGNYYFHHNAAMAANHNTDPGYCPTLSAAGVIYKGHDGILRLSSRFGGTRNVFPPQQAQGHPINICSSSDGLIACHDPTSNTYYIGNPQCRDSHIRLPQPPRQHDPRYTSAVLVSDFYQAHGYHLICAVFDSMTEYNFDVYSSFCGRWLPWLPHGIGRFDLQSHIIHNTGVSCGTCANWLTEAPQSVIRFNVNSPQHKVSKIPLDRNILGFPGTMLQLGRVGNKLGLVTLDASSFVVRLYLLWELGSRWEFHPYAAFNLPISNLSATRLIRFQGFNAELFFWVDEQLFLWEEITGLLRVVNTGEAHVGYGLAHVSTPLLPRNFPVMIQQ